MQHRCTPRRRPPTRRPARSTDEHPRRRLRVAAREGARPRSSAHLEAENAYTEQRTAHLADLRQQIFDEIKARTRETDLSVPTRNRGHWYYGRSFEGREYGASCRVPIRGEDDWTPPKPAEDSAPDEPALPGEELLLDLDALAEGHEFFSLGGSSVSPDGTLLAYSTDVVGDERYTIRIKDLTTGELRADEIVGVIGGATWDRDGERVYYTTDRRLLARRQDLAAPARHQPGRGRAGPPRGRRPLLGRRRPHPHRPLPDDRLRLEDHRRSTASSTPTPPRPGFAGLRARGSRALEYSLDHAVIGGEDRLPGAAQPHRPRLRARPPRPIAPTDPDDWQPLIAARPRRTPRGRRRASPATSWCTSAARA